MPELPEVETTRRGLEPHVVGRTVKSLVVRNPNLRWPVPAELAAAISGKKLKAIERRGKYLLLHFANGTALWHLGMSGSLRVLQGELLKQPAAVHDHVDLVLSGGVAVRFTDPRRFGALLWTTEPLAEHPLLAHLGPEPLTDAFNANYLYAKTRKRSQPIKTLIMDSKVVVGVGNIYANEALFAAGIRPGTGAGRLSKPKIAALVEEIKKVLASAITQGGTTLRDFTGGDGKPGYFAQRLSVYGRGGKPCRICSQPLVEVRMGNRSTVYCRQCQK
ncbi:bifunctional DNA-formamidopyrimidine glycosylase/DNA-(apurinic or apyrimidinic site) lyase [Halioxenophilus sp. WMMB6]|uniref:bifunctional DNA-formamidopyrimidine glycosylase/DNA-(apurinic or apyrimidinic site) lyase n=1 Tax=Halioxenophilus sp. WMMB6 TaxID=3073815 RepID=UPI00295EC378|nr:bifunctional DNA-formamidopyrimidine glycosylase/DNA-(apurinic or apyrimidinic site) lyase [Halioxenophilus sp. WMMB6]